MILNPTSQINLLEIQKTFPDHNYHFVSTIGSGGFGSIFLVRSDKYNLNFCIKKISQTETSIDITKNEATTLVRLCHPNIISMYEFFYDDSFTSLYIVLEYCSGGSLRDLVIKEGPIKSPKLYSYCYQIINALLHCHEQNIAHRDIKPSNILLDNYGRPKLADFGLSKMLERGKNIKSNAGSHQFMAPEIISSVEYDPFLADVWSLGITFYVIAFGKLPWTYHNVEELDVAIKSGIFTFPSYADREFCMLIRAMTNVNPLKREPLAKLINYPVFKNITKYSYASMSHKKVGNIITNKRSEIEVPSSVSHGTILCNRTNNKLYLLKKQELKRNIKVVRTFAD